MSVTQHRGAGAAVTAPSGANGRPAMRRRATAPSTVLAVASLGMFVAFLDATIVNIAFPDIVRSFPTVGLSSLSWVLNAYNIVFAAFLVAAGRFADLLGRRRVFTLGLAVFTLASALCAIAPSAGALVAFRVLQALGAALLVPSSLALVLEAFPAERRSHAVALLTAVGALAAGMGPSIGGLLVSASSWRLVFLVNVPIGIAAVVLVRRHIVESRTPGRRRLPDLLGALLFAVAIATLVLGVVKGTEWGWGSVRVLASFAAAAACGALFVRRCMSHREPLLDLSLLRIRTFSVANAMSVVAAAGFFGYTLCNVLFLTSVWGYPVLEAGLALTPGPFVAVAVAGPTSRLAERLGPRPVLVAGGAVWGAGVLWLVTRVGTAPAFVDEWLPGMVLLGIGAGTLFPNLSATAIGAAPGERFATATGLNSVARQVGAALGVAVVVAILGIPAPSEAAAAFDDAWTFCAVCLLAAGAGCLAVGRVRAGGELPSLGAAARAVLGAAPPELADPRPAAPARPSAPTAHRQSHPVVAESIADFLAGVPIFAEVPGPLRDALAERSRTVRLRSGEWLFHEGDIGDALYVVRGGRLRVIDESADTVLGEFGRGAAVGELALLTSSTRTASVRAARDSDLIAVDREDFDGLLTQSPELALALTRTLATQLGDSRGVRERPRPAPTTVALVPLHPGLPVRELAAALVDSLGAQGRVMCLDGSESEPPVGGGQPLAAYGPLLDRCEAHHDQVLLLGTPRLAADPWTAFALQQADRVLALTAGGPVPEGVGALAALDHCDLVACGVAAGSGVLAGWCEALDPIETHTCGTDLAADARRMARRLTGRSVGLVLSGGGARAFSHIGVIEELLAAGITIDRVAGVSMGAFVGAMLALGMDGEEMDARCYDEWVRRRPLSDYSIPRHGLIRGHRFEALLARNLGPAAIEELDRSFVCASADLRRSELVLHRHGSLREHVATSMCMPILAPPQVRGRRLLIDGSLIDNLPVGALASLGEGPLIAVDVKASFERPAAPPPGASAAGGTTRRSRPLAGGGPPPPGLGETLTRLLLLASSNTSQAAERHADLVIRPRSDGVGLLEFHQLDRAREAGRFAARSALEDAPASLFT
jgi:NTE family protein